MLTTEYMICFQNLNFNDLMKAAKVKSATYNCFKLENITNYQISVVHNFKDSQGHEDRIYFFEVTYNLSRTHYHFSSNPTEKDTSMF